MRFLYFKDVEVQTKVFPLFLKEEFLVCVMPFLNIRIPWLITEPEPKLIL